MALVTLPSVFQASIYWIVFSGFTVLVDMYIAYRQVSLQSSQDFDAKRVSFSLLHDVTLVQSGKDRAFACLVAVLLLSLSMFLTPPATEYLYGAVCYFSWFMFTQSVLDLIYYWRNYKSRVDKFV